MNAITISRPTDNAPQNDGSFRVANIGGGVARHDVSRQWLKRPDDQRFLSLDDLYAFTKANADASQTFTTSPRELVFTCEDENAIESLKLETEAGDFAPTHWSISQACQLADFRASELRKLPGVLAAAALNWTVRRGRDAQVQVYTGGDMVRAMTGPRYGRVFDHEVVKAVSNFAATGNWKVPGVMNWGNMRYDPHHPVSKDTTTLYASDRDVFIFLVDDLNPIEVGRLPNGDPDYMFRGFWVTNSEVGKSSLKIASMLIRGICCNRILWGTEDFQEISIRHTHAAPERFMQEAMPALRSFVNDPSTPLIEHVKSAKEAVVAETEDAALDFLIKSGFTSKKAKDICKHDAFTGAAREDGDFPRTVWDMTQAITAEARNVEHTDARIEMETTASKLFSKVK